MILRIIFVIFIQSIVASSAIASKLPVLHNMILESDSVGTLTVRLGSASYIDSPWGDRISTSDQSAQITIFRLSNNAWLPVGYLCNVVKGGPIEGKEYTYSKLLIALADGNYWDPLCSRKIIYGSAPNVYCIAYAIDGDPVPGECKAIAPPPVKCDTTTGDILLDHKTVNELDLEKSKATSNFTVSCNLAAKVKFSLQGGKSTLDIGGGVSTIKIDDKPLLSDIDLKQGENKMTISSTLSGVKPGAWQSSVVLVIEPI